MSPQSRISRVRTLVFSLTLVLMGVGEAVAQVQLFKAPQAFPAGPTPIAEAAGDFNGDGKIDLVFADIDNNTINIILGNGDGTFQPPTWSFAGNYPVAIAVGDFNGDGKLDIAELNYGGFQPSTVGILLGNGDGTFQSIVNYAVAPDSYAMTVGNFGNRKLDIAVNNGTTMSVLVGNGDGTFQPAVNYSTGYYNSFYPNFIKLTSSWIATGDVNGDGKLDLLVAATYIATHCTYTHCNPPTYYNYLEVFIGNGDGTFQTQNYAGCCNTGTNAINAISVGDLNGDGKLDIAAPWYNQGDSSSGLAIFLGNGDGTLQGPVNYGTGSGPGALAIGDLNGDGKPDVAVSNISGGIDVLLGNGDGSFQAPVAYVVGDLQAGILISDFNGDEKADIAVVNANDNGTVTILLGKGDGTFIQPPELPLGGGSTPLSVATGDFNGDGKLDIAVVDYNEGVTVLLGNGDGTFQTPSYVPSPSGNPSAVATGDFDGDKKLDLAVASAGGVVFVMLGNGDGTFQSPVVYPTTDQGSFPGIAVGDLNGDGKLDLVVTNGSGSVDILLGNGDGTFQQRFSYITGQPCDPTVVMICMEWPALADFNGDGKLDLAVPDASANTVNVLLGNGDGTFQPFVSYPGGDTSVAVGDFNGDGKMDIVSAMNLNGTIIVLLGNGDGTFNSSAQYWLDIGNSGPSSVITGDFNGDGKLDIAAQENGMLGIMLGNGDGTFGVPPMLLPVTYSFGDAQLAGGIAAGDFNGDYTSDLVVGGGLATLGDTTVSVLFNTAGFYLYVTNTSNGGTGTVSSSPSGINCGNRCSANFTGGSKITLTATPNSASSFTGWSGACSGTGTCTVTMKAVQSVTAAFGPQDFSITPKSMKLTVQPGGQGTDVLTLAGVNGSFSSAIQLTCAISGPAPMPTCALSPDPVTPGSNSVTSTLTITAPATSAMLEPSSHRQLSRSLFAVLFPLMFGVAVVAGSRRQRHRHWPLCGFLVVLLLFLQTACGGSSTSSGTGKPSPTNYTVTITGTSGAIQHTTQVGVTVQ